MVFTLFEFILDKAHLHKISLQYEILADLNFPNKHLKHPSWIGLSWALEKHAWFVKISLFSLKYLL